MFATTIQSAGIASRKRRWLFGRVATFLPAHEFGGWKYNVQANSSRNSWLRRQKGKFDASFHRFRRKRWQSRWWKDGGVKYVT